MADVRLERALKVPADSGADALGETLKAIAEQQGMWRGFALHVGLGELRLPDVGYIAIPIRLTASKDPDQARTYAIAFTSANLPAAFPGFNGVLGFAQAGLGESTLFLRGAYELPLQFFGRLFDAALMPRVAERSLENFLDEIASACEARVNQREAEYARYQFFARNVQ